MARNCLLRPSLLRTLLRIKPLPASSLNKTLVTPNIISPPLPSKPFSNPTTCYQSSHTFFLCRAHCSSTGPSNIVSITSEEQFNGSLNKVQDESLPAIFYFTAVWCGPCKFISPIIEELSKKYPHVTTYKIDIDQEGLGKTLSKLNICSVPTLHFFQNGKKATEVIGADIARLKDTMENLYK